MVKLSIIIPVYNVESYIQATAVSLFEQHSPDIEYIFVNDCTPDRSWEVLAETLNKYPECRSASKLISLDKNGGVENARICGLQYAGGEYIWFIDSDDLIAEGAIKIILEALTEKAVDYLSINFQIIKDGEKIPAVNNGNIVETISPEELFSAVISYHGKHAAWRHIVKRFLTLQHPMLKTGLKIAEDYVMHSCWSIHAESAAIIKTPVYGYVTRQQSVMNSNSRLTILQSTREAIQTLKKFADTLPENKKNYFL